MKKSKVIMLSLIALLFAGTNVLAQVSVQISIAPPEIPVYEQPPCPIDGYLWSPGYWAYNDGDYYWVPGVWVEPVQPNYLWTPGYWGYEGGYYRWNEGYWGPHIGYYGGVFYGHGYFGEGYSGGRWEGGHFRYNTAVSHVNITEVHNTYIDKTEIHQNTGNRPAFNGPGGVTAKPTNNESQAMNESHVKPSSEQQIHERAASKDKSQFASINKGRPATTGLSRVKESPMPERQNKENPAPAKNATESAHSNIEPQQHGTVTKQNVSRQKEPQAVSQQHNSSLKQGDAQVQQHTTSVKQENEVSRQKAPRSAAPQQHNQAPKPHNEKPHAQEGHRGK